MIANANEYARSTSCKRFRNDIGVLEGFPAHLKQEMLLRVLIYLVLFWYPSPFVNHSSRLLVTPLLDYIGKNSVLVVLYVFKQQLVSSFFSFLKALPMQRHSRSNLPLFTLTNRMIFVIFEILEFI